MEIIKIKKKDIILLRLYILFMSGILMLYLNMCHNKNFLKVLNLDFGMAQLMKNIAYLIMMLLILFYCYLYSYFWKQIYYQLGVIFAWGYDKRTIIKKIIKKQIIDMFIYMLAGVLWGYSCYILLLYTLGQSNYTGIVIEPVLLLSTILGLGGPIQYKVVMSKSIMEFIKVNKIHFKNLKLPVLFARVLAVFCLLAGFGGMIYLKKNTVVITSLWRSVPILIEVIAIYLIIKYGILFSVKKRKGKGKQILLIEYVRCEFNQLALIISSVAIATFLSIFVTTIVLCSNTATSKEVLEYDKPFEFVFDITAKEEGLLSDYIKELKDKNAEMYHINFLMGNLKWETENFDLPVMIVKQSDYNQLNGEEIDLSVGNAAMLSQVDKDSVMVMEEADGREWSFLPLGEIEFECGKIQKINLKDEIWNIAFNLKDQNMRTLILNDKDYNNLISANNNQMCKFMINSNGNADTKKAINTMLKNVTVDNLIVRDEGISYQYAQRRIMVVFTFLTAMVMLACLIIFQMLRLISEKEKWEHSKRILWILGVEKTKLYKELKKRMNIQTLYPALGGGTLALFFSQIYIREFNFAVFASTLFIFLLTLFVEFVWRKYTVFYLNK